MFGIVLSMCVQRMLTIMPIRYILPEYPHDGQFYRRSSTYGKLSAGDSSSREKKGSWLAKVKSKLQLREEFS